MPGKKALLCGVVLPLACVSLSLQPVMAAMPKPQAMSMHSDVVRVQQTEPEEPVRKPPPKGEEQPAPPAQEPQPRSEPAPQPEPQRPAPPPRAEEAPAQREQPPEPRRERERPRAADPSNAAPERAPEAEAPRPQGGKRPAPPAEQAPGSEPAPEPKPQRPTPPPRAEDAPAQREQPPEPRRERERPRAAEPSTAAPERAPEAEAPRQQDKKRPAPPAEQAPRSEPAPQPKPEQPAPQPPSGEAPAQREQPPEPRPEKEQPPVTRQPAKEQAPEAPPAPQPAPETVPAPGASPAPQPAPAPEGKGGPRPGGQPADAPRESGAAPGAPASPEAAVPPPEAPPMTPEELKRARAIADNPASTDETVVLPVNRGAAVLDSDKDAEGAARPGEREERRRQRQDAGEVQVPKSDAEAQQAPREGQPRPPVRIEPATAEQGERIDRRPQFERPEGVREWQPREERRPEDRARVILEFGNNIVVRGDDRERFMRDRDADTYYERLPGGRVREVVERRDGTRVVTITDRYGDVIQRSRIDERGREYVLFYAPETQDGPYSRQGFRDPGLDLPPMRLGVPLRDYIIDTSSEPDRDYYRFLAQPPVEPVERVYSLDEVRYSARIRDKARRIDLDTLTFATGSADIPMNQARTLRKVADAMKRLLADNPAESFLIEGHTDAVGSDESNLILSDERAASVANVLTDVYGIPPENMVTQGYGERYLKVRTQAAEQANRRVTIRRVTALVKPVAAR